jgi:hypothetical protein
MTRTHALGLPALLATLVLFFPDSARAQTTPKTFFACYVSSTGTIYLIKEPGLRTDCANQNHIPFSWIDGVPGYDHGVLNGRGDDDHPQYLLADGTRLLTGPLHLGGFKIVGLGAGTEAGDAVRFEQAVKSGDAAAGDLSGTYPNPSVARLQGQLVSSTAPIAGQVLSFAGGAWTPVTPPTGITDHGLLNGLTDDDHSQYLLTDGVRASTNGFAVTGTLGSGTSPASGPGTRLMWYPGKAAFRAGSVDAGQWDDASVGQYSTAMGLLTTASGAVSTALGSHTIASGLDATALGSFTMASGDRSTAIGLGTVASGAATTALGRSTTASGDRSTAMGTFASTNSHPGSFVYGDESTFGTGALVQATAANQFVVRAAGGFRFRTSPDLSTGCDVTSGALTCSGPVAAGSGGFVFPDGTVQTSAATGGVSGYEIVSTAPFPNFPSTIAPGTSFSIAMICPGVKKAVGGGYDVVAPASVTGAVSLLRSAPTTAGASWQIFIMNGSPSPISVNFFVVCVAAL